MADIALGQMSMDACSAGDMGSDGEIGVAAACRRRRPRAGGLAPGGLKRAGGLIRFAPRGQKPPTKLPSSTTKIPGPLPSQRRK
jgi:hypothetical protein